MPHILVISPERSHPQDQGNNNRIFRLTRALQEMGATVHFLYSNQAWIHDNTHFDAMRSTWDHLHFVPFHYSLKQRSFSEHYHIDDWYDPAVTQTVQMLCSQWNFSACLVNYVWFSKALLAVPNHVHKIIDTHDVFGNRAEVCRKAGFAPSWFYTSVEEERRGLARADTVIAIQPDEQAYYQSIFSGAVREIGYLSPFTPLPPRQDAERLCAGYLASGNPFNVSTLYTFEDVLLREAPELITRMDFVVAGQICDVVAGTTQVFKCLGRVENVADFYRDVDMVLNPMQGGTGLKIKTLEAMAYNRPVLGTPEAFVGIPMDEGFVSPNMVDLVQHLVHLADNPDRLKNHVEAVTKTFTTYAAQQHVNIKQLFEHVIE